VLVSATTPDGTSYQIVIRPPPMRVGLTCAAADYASHAATFPRAAFCRIFADEGKGLPKLGRSPWPEWASFKDWPTDAALNGWLDTVTRPTIITYHHERDNDPGEQAQSKTARSAFFARWRHLYDVVCAHRNRPLVQAIPIQTLQWTVARSSPAKGLVKGDGDWRTWWTGAGDGLAVDAYVDGWAARYPDPEKWLALLFEAAEGTGRRLWLPELGSVLLGGDTGAGRASWIRDVTALLRERGCAGVAWWCAIGKPGSGGETRDFHLTDQPSADAWRAAIDGSST
jgi:hypothetical protein